MAQLSSHHSMSRRSIPGGTARDAGHQSTAAICVDPWLENWAGNGQFFGYTAKIYQKLYHLEVSYDFWYPLNHDNHDNHEFENRIFRDIHHPFWSILGYPPFWETSIPHFQSLDAVSIRLLYGVLGRVGVGAFRPSKNSRVWLNNWMSRPTHFHVGNDLL